MENVGNKYNLKAIIAGLLFILFGIVFVLADIFVIKPKKLFGLASVVHFWPLVLLF